LVFGNDRRKFAEYLRLELDNPRSLQQPESQASSPQ
jgi:hypothetical protein